MPPTGGRTIERDEWQQAVIGGVSVQDIDDGSVVGVTSVEDRDGDAGVENYAAHSRRAHTQLVPRLHAALASLTRTRRAPEYLG